MIPKGCIRFLGWTLLIAMFSYTGCRSASPPVEFYTLNSAIETPQATQAAEADQNIAVGVGPMEIPKIIDRPQIVSRTSPNKINMDEFHRWGGSLYEDILRVITANLSILLKTDRVAAYPWEDYFRPDYRIALDVHQFDGSLGEQVVLNVTWTVTGREGRNTLFVRKSLIKEPALGTDFEAFVSAKSRALATLSREMAAEIKILHSK
ncbi:MAG: membrane integrity-associated transporter subunit PqiC [Desulfobacterales bacterium]|nr:MAG: membrane integrity-associated transporter subunit PqiC [Desulfobacterales bacterium]